VGEGRPRANAGDHLNLRSLASRARNRGLAEALARALPVKKRPDLVRLGSDYGGYFIPGSLPTKEWICYSAGVGEDVSFDLEMITRYDCDVFAFDPTPRAIAYATEVSAEEARLRFHPWGLWSADGEAQFFAPTDPAHVSHSITNLQRTTDSITVPVRSLTSTMAALGHTRVDLLKLDIEGAEHEVVRSLLATDLRPRVICMELDQPAPVRPMLATVRSLLSGGYDLVSVDRWNYTFVLRG
jgi:FkbM family methyltransferase